MLVSWCQSRAGTSWSEAAQAIQPFSKRAEGGCEFNAQARALLESAPSPHLVVAALASRIRPTRYSPDKLADIIAERCSAFFQLLEHSNPEVVQLAREIIAQAQAAEAAAREREQQEDRRQAQSFE